MKNQEILAKPPEGATHFSWDGYYLKYDINRVLEIYHVNYKHWQQASTWVGVDRSLADIRRIVELEKDRDIRDLEQQAKGLEDFAQSLMFRGCLENSFNKYDADEAAIELRSQAKALKEQVKP